MKTLSEIKQTLYAQLPYLKEKYGVVELGIFGSYSRNEQRDSSDVDLLVEFHEINFPSLLGLVQMETYLSDILKIKVDVVPKDSVKPMLKPYIFKDIIML
jgi:predicted nucleotidyltransferase